MRTTACVLLMTLAIAVQACGVSIHRRPGDPRVVAEIRPAQRGPILGGSGPVPAPGGGTLYLGPQLLIANADVTDVSVLHEGAAFVVMLHLTRLAGDRVAAYTAHHQGEVLAVVLDGKVITAPSIKGSLGRDVVIDAGLSESEAQRLAHGLAP
ncbi:MAG TPA: hypothetical protein VMW75_22220 [Thermoanaerobaculia bacterium]|nr:hypothetical protein [Thermoanaerobaculia bacterium]